MKMMLLQQHSLPFLSLCFFLSSVSAYSPDQQQILSANPPRQLDLDDVPLNFSSNAPHIFSSVQSLLQQWPNTFFPVGHSIVPCEIPAYTLLHHGRPMDDLPPSPEFLAFDIEMAFAIMGNSRDSHMLTYQTTRPVKCLYFDGQSAALTGWGTMDAQMVFLYGNTTGPVSHDRWDILGDEYRRASGLCDWAKTNGFGGPGWGIEGIIRMNAGFEMMWCNFSSPSLQLLHQLNVTAPLLPKMRKSPWRTKEEEIHNANIPTQSLYPLPSTTASESIPTNSGAPEFPLPDNWRDMQLREPYLYSAGWEWFRSTTWQYGTSGAGLGKGESRIKPLTCGFMTYYHPQFLSRAAAIGDFENKYLNLTDEGFWKGPGQDGTFQSALRQLERRRRNHNLWKIDASEAILMNEDAKQALTNLNQTNPQCTGVDWPSFTDEIVRRYSKPLLELSEFFKAFNETFNSTMISLDGDSTTFSKIERYFLAARIRSHGLLLPFLEYPDTDLPESSPEYFEWLNKTWTLSSPLGQKTFSRCRYHYTRLFHSDDDSRPPISINPQESLLISSTEEVLSSICSTIISIGFGIERIWATHFNLISSPPPTSSISKPTTTTPAPPPLPTNSISAILSNWHIRISTLLAYLSWTPLLITCSEPCAWDETCHIPMWPLSPMFAPVAPKNPSNMTMPPWFDGNFTRPGRRYPYPSYPSYPYGYGPPPDRGRGRGPPPGEDDGGHGPPGGSRNRSLGHGGSDNLPPIHDGFWIDLEDGLWEPRCIKIQDWQREHL